MVELADSLDSGSSVHSGRAGSTPASRTISEPTVDTIISCRFVTFYPKNLCGYGVFSFVYEPPIEDAPKVTKSRIIVGLLVLDYTAFSVI